MWEEAFQDLLKSCVCFRWGLEGSNKEKMGRQQKQEVLKWNVRKTRLRGAGDHLLKLHVLLDDCEWGWGGAGRLVWQKMGLSPKREVCLKRKNNMWGGVSGHIEIMCVF